MSTGYSWEGIRQVRATLLGARHVPERLCGGRVYLGRYIKCSTFTFLTSAHLVGRVGMPPSLTLAADLYDIILRFTPRPVVRAASAARTHVHGAFTSS